MNPALERCKECGNYLGTDWTNAHLIAAAPELLQVCRDVLEDVREDRLDNNETRQMVIARLTDALAHATGK